MKIKKEKISKRKIIGLVFISISIIFSLVNILSVKITGGVVGINVGSSFITVLTIIFFVTGLLFISRVGKGLATLVLAGGAVIGIHQAKAMLADKAKLENISGIDGDWDVERKSVKYPKINVGNYQTIQKAKDMPAIIIESFYGTNKNDLEYFLNRKNRKKFCDNVVRGIEKYAKSDPKIKIITIAGGHGKNDPGAKFGPNGNIHESDFNGEMSKYISDKLKQDGYQVQYLWYTGKGNQKDRLNEYVAKANKYAGKSVYVEMHADVARKGVAGSKVYCPKAKDKNQRSRKFGKTVLDEINKSW